MFCEETFARYGVSKLPQYGLFGSVQTAEPSATRIPTVFLNTNVPFSAFLCGLQGSGKSHTTACIIGKKFTQFDVPIVS